PVLDPAAVDEQAQAASSGALLPGWAEQPAQPSQRRSVRAADLGGTEIDGSPHEGRSAHPKRRRADIAVAGRGKDPTTIRDYAKGHVRSSQCEVARDLNGEPTFGAAGTQELASGGQLGEELLGRDHRPDLPRHGAALD